MNQHEPSRDTGSVSALLDAAHAHVREKRTDLAEQSFQRALMLEPKNMAALRGLAEIAVGNKDFVIAWKYAAQAATEFPTVPNITLLADIAKYLGHMDKALKYYSVALQTSPDHTPALRGLAEVYEYLGYRARAVKCYGRALEITPHDLTLLERLAKISDFADAGRVADLYQQALPLDSAPLVTKLRFHSRYAMRREAAERFKHGLSSSADSPDDLHIRFAIHERDALEAIVDAALTQNPTEPEALHYKGDCLLARGMLTDAEKNFHAYAANNPTSIYHTIFFADDFYRALEGIDPSAFTRNLPPLVDVRTESFAEGAVIFLSCDIKYFMKFARPFLASMNDVATGGQVHVHIMNATDEELQNAVSFCANLTQTTIAISAEDARDLTVDKKEAKLYFHAIRFIRMLHYLMTYQKPLWLMDVDGLMNRDPRGVIDSHDNPDLMLFAHAGRWQPWLKFNASAVGVRPTPQGIRYLRLVAAYISQLYTQKRMWWGVDQLALYGVYEFLRRAPEPITVGMLPGHMLDGNYTPEGIVWTNGTVAKFHTTHGSDLLKEPPDSPRVRYLAALEKYAPADEP